MIIHFVLAQGDDRSRKFPGVVLLSERPEEKYGSYVFKPEQVIGYCIGEFVSNSTYEIVTTWVDPKYKGMNNSIEVNHLHFIVTNMQ